MRYSTGEEASGRWQDGALTEATPTPEDVEGASEETDGDAATE